MLLPLYVVINPKKLLPSSRICFDGNAGDGKNQFNAMFASFIEENSSYSTVGVEFKNFSFENRKYIIYNLASHERFKLILDSYYSRHSAP